MKNEHVSVLLEETMAGLAIKPDGIYIDATFGRGGHSAAILNALGATGKLLAIDKDPEAIAFARQNFEDARFKITQAPFAKLGEIAQQNAVSGKVDGVLLDLGVSSPQLDDPERGFSFLREGPLDMRMDPHSGISAAEWLATAKEADIVKVLFEYGEEKFARRIARAIVNERVDNPINTTTQLASIASAANPAWERNKHPATRTFQAVRIFVNKELNELENCLEQVLEVLAIGGRLVVISFHSLEDRIVKRFIRRHSHGEQLLAKLPIMAAEERTRMRTIGRVITANENEITNNPRSRSAKLRIAEKLL